METTEQQPVFEVQPRHVMERNFRLSVLNGVMFIFGESLFDPTLVIPSLVSRLTSSAFLLGLFTPISNAGWYLPQFFTSSWVQNQPRKILVYRTMTFVRITCWLLLAASVILVRNPAWILVTLIISYSIASLASGIGGLPFLAVLSKIIPANRRGEVFAWRLGLGGLLGILSGGIVRWVLGAKDPIDFPGNFGILAGAFFIFASISILLFTYVHELPDRTTPPRRSLFEQLQIAYKIIRSERNYRLYLLTTSLMFIASSAAPFYAIYVHTVLGGKIEWVGIYLGVQMAAALLSNLVFGYLSHRIGNQKIMVIGASVGSMVAVIVLALVILAKPLVISSVTASWFLVPVFFLQGVRVTAAGDSQSISDVEHCAAC